MQRQLGSMLSLPRRLLGNLALLRRDPVRFAGNLLQLTNPALFEERLIDLLYDVPMHVRFDAGLGGPLRLNVLDSAWAPSTMTGGPNTVINLAYRVARQSVAVRLVSTVERSLIDPAWLHGHAAALVGGAELPEVGIASAADPGQPLQLGPNDVFLATHWTTALQLKAVLPMMPVREFFYMLQEFEPGFYAWSSNYARAVETFGMDFWPVINEAMLADFLLSQPLGRLHDPATRDRAVVFEPAVDGALFHPGAAEGQALPKRLLFYARANSTRNLFGLGLTALRQAAADPAFAGWEFLSIGSRGSVPDLPLSGGHVLRRAPWMDYAGYGDLLRQAGVLLCPMLSPHTSYPVLEMAACGGLSVTNTFATKTAAGLTALSDNIMAADATVEGLAAGLLDAARRVNAGAPRRASLNMAREWGAALDPAALRVAEVARTLLQQPGTGAALGRAASLVPGDNIVSSTSSSDGS